MVRYMLHSGTQYEDPPIPNDDYVQPPSEEKQQKADESISTTEDQGSKESPKPSDTTGKDKPIKISTGVGPYVPPHRYAPFSLRLSKNNDKTEK
jgi:hypothetical protein